MPRPAGYLMDTQQPTQDPTDPDANTSPHPDASAESASMTAPGPDLTPPSTPADPAPEPLFSRDPQPVDPHQVTVDRISSWIVAGVLIIGGLVATIILTVFNWPPGLISGLAVGGWIVLTAVLIWLSHVWPAITYRHLRYLVTERGLEIRRGVIWRSVISLPQARVQHTDVVQGPLQRRYGIATLVAHTAGTKFSTVSLQGLSRDRAMQIRDFLLQGGPDDAV